MSAPRWYVVIDPHGAANVVSDLAPGPMAVLPLLKPAGPHARGDWREVDARSRALAWDAAVAAMNAHNGRVSPHARISPPAPVPAAAASGDMIALARDASFDMTTRGRNGLLAPVGERWCPRCRAALPFASFGGHARRGYQAWCRTCMNRATSARGGRVRRVRDTTGLTRIPADDMRRMAEQQSPAPGAAIFLGPEPVSANPAPPAPTQTSAPAPTATLAPTMQPRLACGCTVTYNCTEAETLRARCTLAQRTVKAERQAGGVSPAATQASADAIRAYHAHRGPFVPGGERGA